ncbi:MAG: nucleotidyltransferase domain-containing protein [Candidatus Bathyarchaeota archaeon]|nr:MAG: nucleotidyltransferase domain-containing protein [Candidatus Bathyarchaeota archaeon]
MSHLTLRDRDAIVTREGLIFRIFGYSHPQNAFICDAEYASAKIFTSNDPRAPRKGGNQLFYKFYNDEGLKLVFSQFPQYTFFHEMLGQKVVGVNQADVAEARKPSERLQALVGTDPKDELHDAFQRVLKITLQGSGLSLKNIGVFGSMLQGFYHPAFSDIDLVVYGKKENAKLRETLEALYSDDLSGLRNEFGTDKAMRGKRWRLKNYSVKEFIWHQKRKLIYGLFDDAQSGRIIKTEFEPVKAWSEIASEYDPEARILRKGWAKINARVISDSDAPFIPSVYSIEPLEVLSGTREALEAVRVFSYMEEFRLQAQKDEKIYVEGNLEEVFSPKGRFQQITLTYCPRYYEQVLKVTP